MSIYTLHKSVHFIGIGGVSMSALAHILLDNNIKVSGSDNTESVVTKQLVAAGAKIHIGQRAENIENPDLVVYTAAIKSDNPELVCAREKGIKTLERASFLGELMKDYKYPVSISGTHGKTTTTSMLSSVFLEAKKNPTILVGGDFPQIGGNYHIGSHDHLIFEGCEYVDSFLKFFPYAAIILNVDKDHLDYFSGIEQIKSSFNKFIKLIPNNGFVVINADDENAMECLKDIECEVITFGENGTWNPQNVKFSENGNATFDAYKNDSFFATVSLNVPGIHNVKNALAVFATADKFGIDSSSIVKGIENFGGAKRRFEYKGEFMGAKVFDDYAHHPTEIKATLNAAKKICKGKLWVAFQPHTYSRTKALLNDFANALSLADKAIITDIYAAREKNTIGISSKDLADLIPNSEYIKEFSDIAEFMKKNVKENDIVITMGAGTITDLSRFLL